ncbi:hypothetical protein CCU22_00500 [Candidatus Legionella polyplacis]|uniref:polyprenyl synthetase family protein n=1 Tax=Candidatus Legionella polyplacis TaxID=2005262 RepID=UPI000C1DCDA7|nr:polyprenyl synthetase family protein [Candidatus Legionella polyplacis]ATW01710.1 hypothetical protein CCU22_00500 [Candidatus Legionella polyplacis]
MNNKTLEYYLKRHEFFLKNIFNHINIPSNRIRRAILYTLFPGGKRIRPMLVYLSGELFKIKKKSILDIIAASIELIHCYSLIHDDLPSMDNDDYRRGKLSCHKFFDEATAILTGNAMQAFAIDFLLKRLSKLLKPRKIISIVHTLLLSSGIQGIISGQSLDLHITKNHYLNKKTLYKIYMLKTEKLISACFKMVYKIPSHPSLLTIKIVNKYAYYLSLALQIQNDYLDFYNKNFSGKKRTSDFINQKKTFASLYDKNKLSNIINTYFQKAKDIILPLGKKSKNLIFLTKKLQKYTNSNIKNYKYK